MRKKSRSLIRKFRNIFEFYKTTLAINLAFSAVVSFFGGPSQFLLMIATLGFVLSIGFKEMFRKDEYLFYMNNGVSKKALLFCGFLLNLVFVFLLLAVLISF